MQREWRADRADGQQIPWMGRRALIDEPGKALVRRIAVAVRAGGHRSLQGVRRRHLFRGSPRRVHQRCGRRFHRRRCLLSRHSGMERVDDVRVRGMVLGALFVMLEEARTHQGWRGRSKAGGVARQHLLTEVGERRAAERRARSGKGELDDALIEPDDFENLRPLVSVERRDPHLGQHLEGAVLERLHVALLGGPPIAGVALEVAGRRQRLDRCQSQPRTDRLRPIAEETDDVVDLAGFVRLDHEARPAAQPPPHQMVVHGPDRE